MYTAELDQEKDETVAAGVEAFAEKLTASRAIADDLLICRRLDWRMLLARPRLRRVAYVGKATGALVDALKRFSESLTIFASSEESFAASQSNRTFDLLVLPMPSLRDVEMMRHLLKPGGSLYMELHRPRRWLNSRRQATEAPKLGAYLSILERVGFNEIDAYWHRPNFEECREIIPLRDRVALKHVFTRRGGGLKKRMRLLLGRYAAKTGMLERFAPCVSIIAHKTLVVRDAT